ncbi:MAG: alpha/beta fold hydrolase [Leptospira sp.]|nr:alpha/beta fold hydrolase [Leptospira sp.]
MRNILKLLGIIAIIGGSILGFFKSMEQSMIFYPEKLHPNFSYNFPYSYEEINLRMSDDTLINSLFFPSENTLKSSLSSKPTDKNKKSHGIILYFHGNAGSLASWGYIAEDFLPLGWDVLVTDYRSYGKSEGSPDEVKLHSDAAELYEYLKKRFPEQEILPYGRSIGTGIAAKLARDMNTPRLILETPYTSFPDLARVYYNFLPTFIMGYRLETLDYVKNFSGKTLVLHGDRDEIIPVAMGRKFADVNDRVHYVEIPGGQHNNLGEFRLTGEVVKGFLK